MPPPSATISEPTTPMQVRLDPALMPITNMLHDMRQRLRHSEWTYSSLATTNAKTIEDNKRQAEATRQLRGERDTLSLERDTLKHDTVALKLHCQVWTDQAADLHARNARLRRENLQVSEELAAEKQEVERRTTENSALGDQLKACQHQLDEALEDARRACDTLSERAGTIATLNGDIQSERDKVAAALSKAETQSQAKAVVERELVGERQAADALPMKLEDDKAQIDEMWAEVAELKNKVSHAEAATNAEPVANEKAEHELVCGRDYVADHRCEVTELKAERMELNKSQRELSSRVAEQAEQIAELLRMLEKLQDSIDARPKTGQSSASLLVQKGNSVAAGIRGSPSTAEDAAANAPSDGENGDRPSQDDESTPLATRTTNSHGERSADTEKERSPSPAFDHNVQPSSPEEGEWSRAEAEQSPVASPSLPRHERSPRRLSSDPPRSSLHRLRETGCPQHVSCSPRCPWRGQTSRKRSLDYGPEHERLGKRERRTLRGGSNFYRPASYRRSEA